MTLAEAQGWLSQRLKAAGLESAALEATLMLAQLTGLGRAELVLSRRQTLSDEQLASLEDWLLRRTHGEPLQHIFGSAPFYGLELRVTPAVLIPRPETERLVELVLQQLKNLPEPKVLDVGTGSGAIALAVKAECPRAEVFASDISAEALAVARANAAHLDLNVSFFEADLLAELARSLLPQLAVVVSNPPYLPESDRAVVGPEVAADPELALFSGLRGLDHFQRLSASALEGLGPGAWLMVELDPRNVREAHDLSTAWSKRNIHRDLLGRERYLLLRR